MNRGVGHGVRPRVRALGSFHVLPPIQAALPGNVPLAMVGTNRRSIMHVSVLFNKKH